YWFPADLTHPVIPDVDSVPLYRVDPPAVSVWEQRAVFDAGPVLVALAEPARLGRHRCPAFNTPTTIPFVSVNTVCYPASVVLGLALRKRAFTGIHHPPTNRARYLFPRHAESPRVGGNVKVKKRSTVVLRAEGYRT